MHACVEALHAGCGAGNADAAAAPPCGGAASVKSRFLRARLLLLLGRLDDAARAAQAPLAGSAPPAAALLARIRRTSRQRADAERSFAAGHHAAAWHAASEALDAAPLCVALRLLRGGAALQLGWLPHARLDAVTAMRGAPADARAWALLAAALARGAPPRAGLAASQRALAACVRSSPEEAACAAPFARNKALLRAWSAADSAAADTSRADTRASAAALHAVLALASAHPGSAVEAHALLCALHARAARAGGATSSPHDVADALRWCTAALADARDAGADADASAAAAAALHRAWARLLAGDPAAADDAAAARAHARAADADAALAAALDELDAAIAAAAPDFYTLLNVTAADADALPAAEWAALLRRAYRRAALLAHPDKSGAATARFLLIADAFRTLADPQRRREYDASRGKAMPAHGGAAFVVITPDGADAGASDDGAWEFRFDKRDVDAAGDVRGVWVHPRSGARRAGARATPPPGRDLCAAGGAQRGRCLPGRGGSARAAPPRGAAAPLQPPPALQAEREGCSASADVVRNHFGLQALVLEFATPPAATPASAPRYGPRAPVGVPAWRAPRSVLLEWRPLALAGLLLRAGDAFAYELKWLAAIDEEAEHEEEDDSAEAAPPLALVSVDLQLDDGATLASLGVADQRGEPAHAATDLRAAFARHGAAGWLERRFVLPRDALASAVLITARDGGGAARVRAAVRDVRVLAADGSLRAVLLDGEADADEAE